MNNKKTDNQKRIKKKYFLFNTFSYIKKNIHNKNSDLYKYYRLK